MKKEMVGIIIVAHSEELAKSVCEMALQMSLGKDVPIVPAGGLEDGSFGTSISKIQGALDQVYSADGVLILMDLGSAVMTTQMLLEMLPEEKKKKIVLSNAPLVEGAIAAVVASAQGLPLEKVYLAAEQAINTPKIGEVATVTKTEEKTKEDQSVSKVEVVIPNPIGLHARPASLFVQTASRFKSRITLRNISRSGPVVDAKSIMEVATGGTARQGERVLITAQGEDAEEAVSTLKQLIESGFGELGEAETLPRVKVQEKLSETVGEEIKKSQKTEFDSANIEFSGIPASPGYAIAPVFLLSEPVITVEKQKIGNINAEIERVMTALNRAKSQIEEIKVKVLESGDKKVAQIFDFHKMLLEDDKVINEIIEVITKDQINAEFAIEEVFEELRSKFEKLDDQYMKLRAADIKDLEVRVLGILKGKERVDLTSLSGDVILIAKDLSPSDTALLDKTKIKGIATAFGGATSHTSILANMWGIPAVVGLGEDVLNIPEGSIVALDGSKGKLIVNPTDDMRIEFESKRKNFESSERKLMQNISEPAITRDGKRVEIVANIGDIPSANDALKFGAEGVGLLRTEVLYLERQTAPDEKEQYNFYRSIGEIMGNRTVVIRTFDIGGDKPLPYLKIPKEENPFLGLRGVRLYFEYPSLFLTQVKSILKASVGFNFKIMLPMISSVDEVLKIKEMIEQVKEDLSKHGEEFSKNLELGIMVEIPSAGILSDKIVDYVDFFSIGSNDLTQYTLAVDRGNENVSKFYQPFSPALFRIFKMVIDSAHAKGKWVGLCGELAGQKEALPALLGLGLDEFSMNPRSIPLIKTLIRKLEFEKAHSLALELLNVKNASEFIALTMEFFKKEGIEI